MKITSTKHRDTKRPVRANTAKPPAKHKAAARHDRVAAAHRTGQAVRAAQGTGKKSIGSRAFRKPIIAARINSEIDTVAVRELLLYITNDSNLYRQASSIIENMKRKRKSGRYNPDLAVQGWQHLADAGVKAYDKEFGSGKGSLTMLDKASRIQLARELMEYYEDEISYVESCTSVKSSRYLPSLEAVKAAKAKKIECSEMQGSYDDVEGSAAVMAGGADHYRLTGTAEITDELETFINQILDDAGYPVYNKVTRIDYWTPYGVQGSGLGLDIDIDITASDMSPQLTIDSDGDLDYTVSLGVNIGNDGAVDVYDYDDEGDDFSADIENIRQLLSDNYEAMIDIVEQYTDNGDGDYDLYASKDTSGTPIKASRDIESDLSADLVTL